MLVRSEPERRHIDLRAQHRLGKGKRHFEDDILPLALEIGMRLDVDLEAEIAAAGDLTGESERLPLVDAGRNLDRQLVLADLEIDRAALGRGQKRDGNFTLHFLRRRLTARPAATARRAPAEEVAEAA